jgi:hypothetical protein
MIAGLFLIFVGATALSVIAIARRYLKRSSARAVTLVLPLWLGFVGTLSYTGLVADTTLRPLPIGFILLPVALFIALVVVRSKAAGAAALAVPLGLIIGLQSYRVIVELFFDQLWSEGLVPRMLTYHAANFDIVVGLTAPVAAWLSTRGKSGLRAAWFWNIAGILVLANTIARAAGTAPGPFFAIETEVQNLAIGTFPYTFIAGFFAPLAIALHVLALRAIAVRLRNMAPALGMS